MNVFSQLHPCNDQPPYSRPHEDQPPQSRPYEEKTPKAYLGLLIFILSNLLAVHYNFNNSFSLNLRSASQHTYLLPTRPRAGNQNLYRRDTIQELNSTWVRVIHMCKITQTIHTFNNSFVLTDQNFLLCCDNAFIVFSRRNRGWRCCRIDGTGCGRIVAETTTRTV